MKKYLIMDVKEVIEYGHFTREAHSKEAARISVENAIRKDKKHVCGNGIEISVIFEFVNKQTAEALIKYSEKEVYGIDDNYTESLIKNLSELERFSKYVIEV